MKNSRNSYNNTAATRINAFFAKKLTAAVTVLCVLTALASATAVATGSVPCRAANSTASFEGGAVIQAEQGRQQRSERNAADAQKCMALSASAPQENASGSISPSPSSAPGGSSFRLQWYHYAIAAGAILIMTIITFSGVKPAGKKQ